jgi:hypothetical protein
VQQEQLMLNKGLELHDTTIVAFTEVGEQLFVLMRAFIHQSEGKPGIDKGDCLLQAVVFTFTNPTIEGNNDEYPSWIIDGDLVVGENKYSNMFSIPFSGENVELKLTLDNGKMLNILSKQLEVTLLGEPEFVHEFIP